MQHLWMRSGHLRADCDRIGGSGSVEYGCAGGVGHRSAGRHAEHDEWVVETGSPTSYSYQWQDCDSSGGSCSGISGASSSSYTLASSDVGGTVRSVVTATNANGSTSADSAVSGVVAASGGSGGSGAPVNTVQPYFTASTVNGSDSCTAGCAIQGQQLSVTTGSWSTAPPRTRISGMTVRRRTPSHRPQASCSNATGAGRPRILTPSALQMSGRR